MATARVPDPDAVLRGHNGEVQALDFDSRERFLISGDSVGEVRVWDLGDLRPAAIRNLHPLNAGILSLRLFKSGGQLLLGTQGRDGTTLLWACDDELKLSEQPVRSFVRDCYSFCRFSVLAGDPDTNISVPPGSSEVAAGAVTSSRQEVEAQKQAEEFVASALADDAACAASAAPGVEEQQQQSQQQQQQAQQQEQQGDFGQQGSNQAGGARDGSSAALTVSTIAAAIWALHACAQASEQQPPALLAIPGRDERTAEVVCCSCGCQVAEFREEAAGRKLGMLMAVQLYCPGAGRAAEPPAEEQAATEAAAAAAGSSDNAAAWHAAAPGAASAGAPTAGAAAALAQPSICLAAGYEDGSLVIWDVAAPQAPLAQRQLCSEPVMALAVDSSGCGGACGSAEQQVVCFKVDYVRRRVSIRHSIELRKQGIGDVAVRPDRKLLVTAGWDGRMRVYKYRSGRPLAVLKYHSSPVTAIRFAPQSMMLCTAARDGTLALWPLYQPEQQQGAIG